MNNRQKIIATFKRLGFEVLPSKREKIPELKLSVFGTIAPEPCSVGKHHFKPKFRSVYFGSAMDGFYVTSNIEGTMRRYRCRTEYEEGIANIFGLGKTVDEALKDFEEKFTNKIYNNRGD